MRWKMIEFIFHLVRVALNSWNEVEQEGHGLEELGECMW